MKPKVISFLVAIVFALIILIQNSQVVTFRLFWWKVEMSQMIVVLVMLGIGFVLGLIAARFPRT
ncbi:MAG: LapA family protein [Candidatus Krumholzibacteria bacterium]|nr:LapA family protein [Candidatus Krumholzibacteria bacterium]